MARCEQVIDDMTPFDALRPSLRSRLNTIRLMKVHRRGVMVGKAGLLPFDARNV